MCFHLQSVKIVTFFIMSKNNLTANSYSICRLHYEQVFDDYQQLLLINYSTYFSILDTIILNLIFFFR